MGFFLSLPDLNLNLGSTTYWPCDLMQINDYFSKTQVSLFVKWDNNSIILIGTLNCNKNEVTKQRKISVHRKQ